MIEDFLKDIEEIPLMWSSFSDFNKLNELKRYEFEINELNVLIGEKEEFINEKLIELIKINPKTIDVLLLLVAIRPLKLKKMNIYSPKHKGNKYKEIYNLESYDELIYFFENSGLKTLFVDKLIDNLSDYLKGIEIGLDSNSRKNRNGKLMEMECEKIISNWCKLNNYSYYKQKTLKYFFSKIDISKKFDFIIKTKDKYIVIEVNNYNSNGSKIKSISEEYVKLNENLKNEDIIFLWITNGSAWLDNEKLLNENLFNIEHLINFKILKDGYLDIFN